MLYRPATCFLNVTPSRFLSGTGERGRGPAVWHDLGAALALALVLEGILPFANPAGVRRAFALIEQMSDAQLRAAGLSAMLIGLLLLFLVNRFLS